MRRVSLFRDSKDFHSNQRFAMEFRYCFGAPYVCNELAKETVTAGAFAHPAFLKADHFANLTSKYTYHWMLKQTTPD